MFRSDRIFTNVAYHGVVFVVRRLFIAPMVLITLITLLTVQTLISLLRVDDTLRNQLLELLCTQLVFQHLRVAHNRLKQVIHEVASHWSFAPDRDVEV